MSPISPSQFRLSRVYSLPPVSPTRHAQPKSRFPLPPAMIFLLLPLILSVVRTAKLQTTVIDSSERWTQEPTLEVHHAPALLAEGLNVSLSNSASRDDASPLTSKMLPNSSHSIFVPEDVNNPTKVPVPPNGFPPISLSSSHPHTQLLENIRAKCNLEPRWPKHPGLHVVELRSYGPAYSSIVISEKLKVIYVPVFKVASTSMMWHIAYLENNSFVLNQDLSRPGSRDYFLHEMSSPGWTNHSIFWRTPADLRSKFEDPSYLKFGFVRNPFDRVVSAYMDKIANHEINSMEYQTQMYSLYGLNSELRTARNLTKPTFKEFLVAIRDVLKQPRAPSTDLTREDSFEDNNSRRDLHWRPQVELLHPDLIHFDFVGRFENLQEDRQVVLNWIHQHTDRRMPPQYQEKMHSTDPRGKADLFKSLRSDPELKNLVLEIYDMDFRRFQFSTAIPEVEH